MLTQQKVGGMPCRDTDLMHLTCVITHAENLMSAKDHPALVVANHIPICKCKDVATATKTSCANVEAGECDGAGELAHLFGVTQVIDVGVRASPCPAHISAGVKWLETFAVLVWVAKRPQPVRIQNSTCVPIFSHSFW